MATRFITVSIELMHDKNLTANQKFILAEIQQLSQLDQGCIASNQHFSDLTGIARESVSRCIKDLETKGYISSEIVKGTRNHKRIITLNKMLNPSKQNVKPLLTKHQETKENRTINKTNNKYVLFLDYLKDNCKYKSKITKTKDGEKLFNKIEDKKKLAEDYILHQEKEENFAKRITAFMEDYETVYKTNNTSNSNFNGWS